MNPSELPERSAAVKQLAVENGFDLCGIARAEYLSEEASRLEDWLMQNKNGDM
jgi:epoxyqueuosine reductase